MKPNQEVIPIEKVYKRSLSRTDVNNYLVPNKLGKLIKF
jgi:hypothetical protein